MREQRNDPKRLRDILLAIDTIFQYVDNRDMEYSRLCHYQQTDMSVEYGEYQFRANQRWSTTGRKACEIEPDCHSADAGLR